VAVPAKLTQAKWVQPSKFIYALVSGNNLCRVDPAQPVEQFVSASIEFPPNPMKTELTNDLFSIYNFLVPDAAISD
jgi:hypothetical protein